MVKAYLTATCSVTWSRPEDKQESGDKDVQELAMASVQDVNRSMIEVKATAAKNSNEDPTR